MKMINKSWYIEHQNNSSIHQVAVFQEDKIIHREEVNRLKEHIYYELWYHRLGHPRKKAIQKIRSITTGTPTLHKKSPHYRCACCIDSQMTKCIKGFKHSPGDIKPGQRFSMDYGFIREPSNKIEKKGKIFASIDGYTSHLLVVDDYSGAKGTGSSTNTL